MVLIVHWLVTIIECYKIKILASVCTLVKGDLEVKESIFQTRVIGKKLITSGYFRIPVHVCLKAARTYMEIYTKKKKV